MKKITFKNIAIALGILIVLLQFIRTERNVAAVIGPNHISTVVPVPKNVEQLLAIACYDCHSNQTTYPWYTNIQPVGLWMGHHVDEGKSELNFSEFTSYQKKRQIHKLDEVIEMVEQHEMPLSSYTLMHTDAKLSDPQQKTLIEWAHSSRTYLKDSIH